MDPSVLAMLPSTPPTAPPAFSPRAAASSNFCRRSAVAAAIASASTCGQAVLAGQAGRAGPLAGASCHCGVPGLQPSRRSCQGPHPPRTCLSMCSVPRPNMRSTARRSMALPPHLHNLVRNRHRHRSGVGAHLKDGVGPGVSRDGLHNCVGHLRQPDCWGGAELRFCMTWRCDAWEGAVWYDEGVAAVRACCFPCPPHPPPPHRPCRAGVRVGRGASCVCGSWF